MKHMLMLVGVLLAVTATLDVADSTSKPNILWLIAEDACKDFGCYGVEAARTPNIDHLASESCLYRNAFATGSVCSTSRSAFMTGLYQTHIGAQNHRSHRTRTWITDTHDPGAIPEDPQTVAEELKRNEKTDLKPRAEFGLGPNEVLLKTLDRPGKQP